MTSVEPRLSRGLRDLLPDQMLARQRMIDPIRRVYDLDSVGTESDVADTEIVAGMCDSLEALDVGRSLVRFSSRAMLNLLLEYADISSEQGVDVFRVLDKLDKVGLDKVRLELMDGYKDESGDIIRGVGLARDQVERIERFLNVKAEARREVVEQLRELFAAIAS